MPESANVESPEIAKAEAALLKNDWKTAEPILDSWLATHPVDARALFDAGYLADAQGRNEDAMAFYTKAVSANPKSFEAQISLGLLLARMGKSADSRPVLVVATTLDPGDAGVAAKAKAWRALAQIDRVGVDGKADPAQASADLIEALKLTPETTEDTLFAASLAEAAGDSVSAEAAYRRLLKKDPDSEQASTGLAHVLIAQKKYPEAEDLVKEALKKHPEDPALTAQLAAVLVAQDKAEALPLLQEFHQKHPDDAALTRMLAQVNADAGDYEASDELYVKMLAADPKDADLLAGHGQNLIRLHRYAEAMKAFEQATSIDETNGEAWNGLAFASFEMHQPTITLHALSVRSKYLPETATIYFLWATAYDTLHDKKQASAYYHQFLDTANGKFPDQEWQAKQRLAVLEKGR
ncbi:tetratricopeptide repeat protein [Acidicapsa ligni]|uniref:tetratricopeptide repeat protein n=1 Tax=Acidicapsa ligni TaxID=542300 RepID=UPI0021E00095|nr:tetratricopeptide repeat protein [Acidicapsa ligni]